MHRVHRHPSAFLRSYSLGCIQYASELNNNYADAADEAVESSSCNICTASVENRIKFEQTWILWERFLELYSRFDDWLRWAEYTAAHPNSSHVLYAEAKEEVKKYKILQKQVQERVPQLDYINKHYRQLAKKNGIGVSGRLKAMVHDANQRWEDLNKRTAIISKRLKYFISQHEEFELERQTISVWLTEMDLKLTNVEHFSSNTSTSKMKALQAFEQDIQRNTERIDQLLVFGELLIQKSEPMDAECLENKLQDLLQYCQEVFSRVARFHRRLVSMKLVFEDEWLSDRETDQDSDCISDAVLEDEGIYSNTDTTLKHYSTPVSGHSPRRLPDVKWCRVDLEWDPTVDVGGSNSHDEVDSSYFSAITGIYQHEDSTKESNSQKRLSFNFSLSASEMDVSNSCLCENNVEHQACKMSTQIEDNWGHRDLLSVVCEDKQNYILNADSLSKINSGHCCQVEQMTFDPCRIQDWLGQSDSELEKEPSLVIEATPEESPSTLPADFYNTESIKADCDDLEDPNEDRVGQHIHGAAGNSESLEFMSWHRQNQENKSVRDVAIQIDQGQDLPSSDRYSSPETPVKNSITTWLLKVALFIVGLLGIFMFAPLPEQEYNCFRANHFANSFRIMLTYVNGPPPI